MAIALKMQERHSPSRPTRLGTRRRRAAKPRVELPEAGASRLSGAKAPSLDTEKDLQATSVRDWAFDQRTAADERLEQLALQKQLLGSVHAVWQKWRNAPADDAEAVWWASYELELAERGEDPKVRWRQVEKWLKTNKPKGVNAKALAWEKRWMRLRNCQSEWIGYRAACCGDRSKSVAVPIGCNDRLCPFCGQHRAQKARVAIKSMFDRLTHPVLLTLTCPNKGGIKKHDFTLFRQRVRQFIAQHKAWLLGGVYSLETTYNRTEKTWHIHCHILGDMSAALPSKQEKTILAGVRVFAFTALKLKLEFDWARLWVKGWGKMPAKNASHMRKAGSVYAFEQWVMEGRESQLKEWSAGSMRPIPGLSPSEIKHRSEWNRANRRVIDLRPVTDRAGAAAEVLKYITKSADFSDLPEAVEAFCDAVKGARLIQTFGSWYGANFDTNFDPEHMDDWGEMKCACGLNCWERVGVFHRKDVFFDRDGKSYILPDVAANSMGGTVPRPRIRALGAQKEHGETPCQPLMRTR